MICCGVCHNKLQNDNLVTMDFFYTLRHYTCLGIEFDLVIDIDTYENIKNKYPMIS